MLILDGKQEFHVVLNVPPFIGSIAKLCDLNEVKLS